MHAAVPTSPPLPPSIAPPFLASDPPPLVVRSLAALLPLGFLLAIVLSVVIELPVTVEGTFTLVPLRGSDPLRAPRSGIVTEVTAVEGRRVQEGEPLFLLRSELAGDRAGEVSTLEIAIRGAEERLRNERARAESQLAADREGQRALRRQQASAAQQITLADKRLGLARSLLAQYKALYAERLTSFENVQEHELAVSQTEAEIARLRAEEEQARIGGERLGHEMSARAQEIAELARKVQEETDRSRVRLTTLQSAQLVSPTDELVVAAPCEGTVARLGTRAPGAVVSEGAVLGELLCAGEELRAEVAVVGEGIGLLRAGQAVKLYYDAFPYQRHGVRFATVSFLGPASNEKLDRPSFRVLADLDEQRFVTRSEARPLLPGMTGRAEVIVARQSALAYVLEPIRALRESTRRGP
ncbi:MAG: HlyD family efflux transporter periplasmic adaptor subunit [Byssovorax sp.]